MESKKTKPLFKRICSNCEQIIFHTTKQECNRAIKQNRYCKKCVQTLRYNKIGRITDKIWSRKCPKCQIKLSYSVKSSHDRSEKNKSWCHSCRNKRSTGLFGNLNPAKRPEVREKISKNNPMKNPKYRAKVSKSLTGRKRKPFSKEWKNKIGKSIRALRIQKAKERKLKNNQICPNYNPKACEIIEKFNKKYNFNFQHAENGGEKYISGYYPDGIDEKRKVIIEIDEKHHFTKNNNYKKADLKRQKDLENLGYKFIRIKIKDKVYIDD